MSQELEECKAHMKANVAEQAEKRLPLVIISFYQFVCSAWFINLTKYSADNTGGNLETVGDNELHLRS